MSVVWRTYVLVSSDRNRERKRVIEVKAGLKVKGRKGTQSLYPGLHLGGGYCL
jgi:hypothetical protein